MIHFYIIYPLAAEGSVDFWKVSFWDGLKNFWSAGGAGPSRGAPKSRGLKVLINFVRKKWRNF